jgi:hypothetical protein
VLRSRLDALVGTANADEMEAVEVAPAAVLDLR